MAATVEKSGWSGSRTIVACWRRERIGFPSDQDFYPCSFWDTEFVDQLGPDAKTIASDLIGHITKDQQNDWQKGSPSDWAQESFQLASSDAYGDQPAPSGAHGTSYRLSDEYVTLATNDVSMQLSKVGVRLAMMLNQALGKP